jgi:general secretion pathway protein G
VIMTIVIRQLTTQQDEAMRDAAKLGMVNVQQALQLYRVHNHRFPTTDQQLRALVQNPGNAPKWRGPYIEEEKLRDPWGNELQYESDGRTFKLTSGGPDGTIGNEDDVTYPESSQQGN